MLFFLSFTTFAQTTFTSVQNGNWLSPFTWCSSFPTPCYPFPYVPLPGATVIVKHVVVLDTNWLVSTAPTTVDAGASLIEDIPGRNLWVTGSTFLNNGTVGISNLYNAADFINNGTIADVDSFANAGVFINSANADLNVRKFLNIDTIVFNNFTNSGTIEADSLLNMGTFNNSGTLTISSFINTDDFTNNGLLVFFNFYNAGTFQNITGGKISAYDFWNAGYFQIDSNSTFNTSHDFLNGDTIFPSYNAVFNNDGFVGVGNDWYNSDTIKGTGRFCIGNVTYNVGMMTGSFDFCDLTGDSIDFPTGGTVAGSVTFCSSSCSMVVAIAVDNVSCFDTCDGQAVVAPFGGISPYSYLWSTGETTNTISGLCTGIYLVTVIDSTLDTIIASVLITEPSVIVLATSSTEATCGEANGMAMVATSGGTPPYNYQWDDTLSQTDSSATGLYAGTYSVSVTDNNNCSITDSVTVTEPPELIYIITIINASCPDIASGAASVIVTGGTPGYTYLWNDPNSQTTSTANGLAAGTYSVLVTDNNNCSSTDSVTITESPELDYDVSTIDASCPETADGSAIVSTSVSVMPYTYLWEPPVGGGDGSVAMNLVEGIYFITITDNNGCFKIDTIEINVIGGDDCMEWYIYSGITPDGDGIDDVWIIKGLERFKSVSVIFFNRWGDIVYESDHYKNNWNGINQEGKPLPNGVYYYVVKRDGEVFKGWVTVLR